MKSDLKILFKVIIDVIIVSTSSYFSVSIIDGRLTTLSNSLIFFIMLLCATIIPAGTYFKIYRDISRYFNLNNVSYLFLTSSVSCFIHFIIIFIFKGFNLDFTKTILIFYNFKYVFLIHLFYFLCRK